MLLVTVTPHRGSLFWDCQEEDNHQLNKISYGGNTVQLSIIGAVTEDKDAYTAQYMTFCPVARGA